MNPNSISHRLFVAALTQREAVPPPRPTRVAPQREAEFEGPKKVSSLKVAAQKMNEWSWSGWQQPTI